MELRQRVWLVFLMMVALAVASAAESNDPTQEPLFNEAGALLWKPHGMTDGTGAAPAPAPWTRWSIVSDGSSDQFAEPDLAVDTGGSLHSVFTGTVFSAFP